MYLRLRACLWACCHTFVELIPSYRGDECEWWLQHKPVVKAMQAEADADLRVRWQRYEWVRDRQDREATKYTRYCREQCGLLHALRELAARERTMYELENSKD